MSRGVVREPRTSAQIVQLTQSRRRQIDHVRRADLPDLQIDRVLVCPSGVYVVTDGDPDTATIARATASAGAVSGLLPARYRNAVRAVVCRRDGQALVAEMNGVMVTSEETLAHITRSSRVVLSTSEVGQVATRLDTGLEPFPVEEPPRSRRRLWVAVAAAAVTATGGAVAVLLETGTLAWPL